MLSNKLSYSSEKIYYTEGKKLKRSNKMNASILTFHGNASILGKQLHLMSHSHFKRFRSAIHVTLEIMKII